MVLYLYKDEKARFRHQKGINFINLNLCYEFSIEEAEDLGIKYEEIQNIMSPDKFYITNNDFIVNCLAVTDTNYVFPQFIVKKNSAQLYDYYAGLGNFNNEILNLLVGEKINKHKFKFFIYYLYPKSPYFGDARQSILEVLKPFLESKRIKIKMINNKYVERVVKQKWIHNIKNTPLGEYIMNNLKVALQKLGIDYTTIVQNYLNLSLQEEDRKAALVANKELERLVEKAEEEELKNQMLDDMGSKGLPDNLNKKLKNKFSSIDVTEIINVGTELENLGDNYINQDINDIENQDYKFDEEKAI